MRGLTLGHDEAVDTMAAERYVLGELHDSEREEFEEHFFSCHECAQDVRDLAALTAGAKDVLAPSPKAEPPKQRATAPVPDSRWFWLRWSPNLAWAGALALMTIVAGTSTYQAARLRGLDRPQVVASVLLRPETRGAAVSIPVQRVGAFLLVEADLPGAAGELQWDLKLTGSEKIIERQPAPALPLGRSFKLLLPASMLAPGEYTLTVRPVSGPSEKIWLFKFRPSER